MGQQKETLSSKMVYAGGTSDIQLHSSALQKGNQVKGRSGELSGLPQLCLTHPYRRLLDQVNLNFSCPQNWCWPWRGTESLRVVSVPFITVQRGTTINYQVNFGKGSWMDQIGKLFSNPRITWNRTQPFKGHRKQRISFELDGQAKKTNIIRLLPGVLWLLKWWARIPLWHGCEQIFSLTSSRALG